MKALFRSLILLLTAICSHTGLAAPTETYAGVDLASMTISFPQSRTTPAVDHTELAVRARIGAVLFPETFPGLSLEAHLGSGIAKDGETVNFSYTNNDQNPPREESRTAALELESMIGLYLRADMFSVDRMSFYGLLGFSSVQSQPRQFIHESSQTDSNGNPVIIVGTEPETQSSISFALGLTYSLDDDMTVQAEYINLIQADKDNEFEVAGFSFGINFALP